MSLSYPLSAFQRAMLSWDKLHPYNAVHALVLGGPYAPEAFRAATDGACRDAGIGELSIDDRGRRFQYGPFQAAPVRAAAPTDSLDESLCNAACAGLNLHFPRGPHHPLHWTVIESADHAAHAVVLAYHHVAADAQAIAQLLADVLRRYLGGAAAAPGNLSVVPPPTALALDPPLRWSRLLRGFGRTLGVFRRMKAAHKMPDERDGGDQTDCVIRRTAADRYEQVARACRGRGVGLNDALIGAFGAAIAERTTDRHTSRRRRKIAIGSVLNERRRAKDDLSGFFGVCLGDVLVLLDDPDVGIDAVIQQAAAQTRARKADAGRSAGAAAMTTFFVDRIWPLFFIRHTRRSYRKLLPICGGVSTFAVDATPFAAAADRVQRYIRACPCGPATPLLLGPTVFRGRLELSLTYRLTCTDRAAAESLLERTETMLGEWVKACKG